MKEGSSILYPDDKKKIGIKKPKPPLKKEIKRLLVIPIPINADLSINQRIGVICVDTSRKDAWQLTDRFHIDLLEWVGHITVNLDKKYLQDVT